MKLDACPLKPGDALFRVGSASVGPLPLYILLKSGYVRSWLLFVNLPLSKNSKAFIEFILWWLSLLFCEFLS